MLIIIIIFIMLWVVSFIILAPDALGGDEGGETRGEASSQTHTPPSCPCWSGCLPQMVVLEDLSSLNILTIPSFKHHLRVQQFRRNTLGRAC